MMKGFAAGLAALALAGCGIQEAREGVTKQEELLARVAIEDLLSRYYQKLGSGNPAAFNEFYTGDAVLEVNGTVAEGRQEIEAIYAGAGDDAPANPGTFHMVLSNMVVDIEGDTATASMLWTGFDNSDLRGPPTIREQGREYDLLVREGRDWRIKKRVVVADSGLPASIAATYDKRENYDITAD
jgi:ketosteroid isomerase-like protein